MSKFPSIYKLSIKVFFNYKLNFESIKFISKKFFIIYLKKSLLTNCIVSKKFFLKNF